MSAESRIAAPSVPRSATMGYSITTHWTGANASGLPVPTSAAAAAAAATGADCGKQQARKIPSTVGSALKRRQASSVSQQASANKAPCGNYSTLGTFRNGQHQQQIKPPSMTRQSSSSISYSSMSKLSHTTTTTTTTTSSSTSFKAHLRLTPSSTINGTGVGRSNSAIAALKIKQKQQQQLQVCAKSSNSSSNGKEVICEDEDDKMDDDVESLPPLKSTSYFSQISATGASDNTGAHKQAQPGIKGGYRSSSSSVVSLASSQDLRSEPIISTTTASMGTAPAIPTFTQRHNAVYGANRITQAQPGKHLYQSAQSLAKPSQLVKPMPQRNTSSGSKFGLKKMTPGPASRLAYQQVPATARQVPGRQVAAAGARPSTGSRLACSQTQQLASSVSSRSRLPTLPNKVPIKSQTPPASRVAQSVARPATADIRRLSSQPSGIRPVRQAAAQPTGPQRHSAGERNEAIPDKGGYLYQPKVDQGDDVESEDFVDANDDANDSDDIAVSEEEELVTASRSSDVSDDTMQMANRELDNMIQMLTSSAILSNSDSRGRLDTPRLAASSGTAVDTSDSNVSKETLCDSGSHLNLAVQTEQTEPNNYHDDLKQSPKEGARISGTLSIKKRPNNASRSQSMSLNKRQGSSTSQVSSIGLSSGSDDKLRSFSEKVGNALPRRSASIKSARPRSRIIFDPMKSEFHVSCTTDADSSDSNPDGDDTLPDVTAELNSSRKDDLTISSDGENTSDDDGDLPELTADMDEVGPGMTSNHKNNDSTIESESATKLLEAQSKIMSLKSLPFVINKSDPSDALDQVTNPLKKAETRDESDLPPKCPTPKRCKSPVGSALRSLLGLGASNKHDGPTSNTASAPDASGKKRTATVTGNNPSLRLPVATNRIANIPTSESSESKSPTGNMKYSVDAVTANPSLIDYYSYGTVQNGDSNQQGLQTRFIKSNFRQPTAQIRPPSMIYGYLRHSPARSISSFKTKKSFDDECKSMYDNDGDEDLKCMPDLKSASYISPISTSTDGHKEQTGSHSITSMTPHRTVSCNRYQSPTHLQSKPSQLVRPILQRTTGANQVGDRAHLTNIGKQQEDTTLGARKLSWPQQQHPVVYGLIQRQSRLPTPPSKSSIGALRMPTSLSIAHKLQYSARPQQVQPAVVPPPAVNRRSDDIDKGDTITTPDGDQSSKGTEEFVDANDSNGSDEIEPSEEDDLLTSSHGSDSMKIANRELNDMIEMLSSSAIITRSNSKAQIPPSAASGPRRVTEILSNSGSHLDLLVPDDLSSQDYLDGSEAPEEPSSRQVRISRKLSIKQRPDHVLKSQSMSFSQQRGLSSSQSSSVGVGGGPDDKFRCPAASAGRDALPRRSASIKSTRPRSRIIFDPIKSEFHVSCIADADSGGSDGGGDDDAVSGAAAVGPHRARRGSLTLDSDDSSASNDGSNAQDEGPPDVRADVSNCIDESSLKLLEAQSKIISLKHLPVVRQVSDMGASPADQGSQSDSPRVSLQAPAPCQLPPKCPPAAAPAKRSKSPVGSALRSLFGLKSSGSASSKQQQQQQRASSPKATSPAGESSPSTGTGARKIATVMRHSSLRLDPRRQTIVFPSRGGIPSLQNKPALKAAAVPVPKSVSIDGGTAPLSAATMDHRGLQGCLSPQSQQQQQQQQQQHAGGYSLGSDLLHRAGRRLSASSSSLTSRFKFIGSPSPSPSAHLQTPSSQTSTDMRRG